VADQNALPHNMTAMMVDDLTPKTNGVFGFSAGIALASLLVLIVACLNVANVMAARGIAKRREIAVRVAIGASGGAIFRYVMAEAVLLAVAGGFVGTTLAVWGVDVVQARMPAEMLRFFFRIPQFNWHVLAFMAVISGVTALLSGVAPALRASRADVGDAMKDGGYAVAGRSNGGYRYVVSGQLVLALMMAMAAAGLLQSLHPPPAQVSPINTHDRYNGNATPSLAYCRQLDHPERFVPGLVSAIAGVQGVRAVAAQQFTRTPRGLVTSDEPSGPVEAPLGGYSRVTPGYFHVAGIPLIAGRDIEPGDAASGAAVVNLMLAKKLWPLVSPIGRAIKLGPAASNAPWVRVVGVASAPIETADGEHFDLAPPVTVAGAGACGWVGYVARVERDDPQTVAAVGRAVGAAIPVGSISPVFGAEGEARKVTYSDKVVAFTYTGVALFMLLLSAAGVFGVMTLVVGQRRREFAVRVALGAEGRDVRRLVLRDAWIMALSGIAIGGLVATHFSPWGGLYLKIVSGDPLSLVLAEAAVVGATVLACISPALRASRVDPVEVLRAS
jgi:predicted permease